MEEENLIGRWVKRIAYSTYHSYGVPIGFYDKIYKFNNDSYYLEKFLSCKCEYLLKNFKLMPIGFNPDKLTNKYYFY